MRQFNVLFRWGWTFLVVVSLGLAGCDGDDGAAGAAGAAGQPGADGDDGVPCWDLNGNGVGDLPDEDINNDGAVDVNDCSGTAAKVTPLESCGVCHDDGSFADATDFHALPPIEAVSNVAFAVNGLDLDVTFDLAADGVLATNYDSMQRGYRTDGLTRTDICGAASRSDPCDPALLTLTNNGGGSYTIKVLGGAAEALNDNRYLFRVGAGADRETRVYFYDDFPATPIEIEPLVVSAEACNACHGPERLSNIHGGYYAAADGGETCVTCHGVDGVPSLGAVAHGLHSSIWEEDGEVIEITYPTYMSNCSVCHSEAAQLAEVNAMSVSGEHCFSCHGSMVNESWDFTGLGFHLTLADPETANCGLCHGDNPETPEIETGIARANVAEFHNYAGEDADGNDIGIVTARGGQIVDGVDTSLTEGEKFAWEITGIADDGVNLTITWQASYDGVGVDPCNDTVGPGAPVFHDGGVDADGNPISRFRTYRSYSQGDDFIVGTSTGSGGQPSRANVTVDNTTCAGNVATTVIPVEGVDAERGRLALNGKPLVVSLGDPTGTLQARVPTPTYDWLVGVGGPAPERRAVVDTSKCVGCHVGSLYQHGGDRVDNVDTCLVCHNSASNEQSVRVGMGVDASEAYDGKAGETFEMKTMLHRVHSANYEFPGDRFNPPYLVYRGRGIYAFAPDVSDVPNWDVVTTDGCTADEIADGKRRVFGSDIGGSDICEVHNFEAPTYPRSLYECTACHTEDDPATTDVNEDFTVIPDQTKSMATTTDAGSTVWQNQIDDVLQGAGTTACVTCHADGASKGHAFQNSWTPQAFPEGRQTIIDAVN